MENRNSIPCKHTDLYFQYAASLIPFKPCFLKVQTPGASLSGYFLIPPLSAHPQNTPLLTYPKSSISQTVVPGAALATDTFHLQKHFPWSESLTEVHTGFLPPSQSITSKTPCLSIYFDPLLNLGFAFLWFPTSALCSSILHIILG